MRILILGSEGFIGSNAVKYFAKQGFKVTSADIVMKNIPGYLLINPEVPSFASLFLNNKFDVCLNATGAANVQFSFAYPHTDFFLNTANVYSILDAIRLYNPSCKFINLSSAAVYGNPSALPIHESATIQATSPYGAHKHLSEQICSEFYHFFGIQTLSLRIFSTYGPGLKKQLFWDLHQKAKKAQGGKISIFGTGDETRDYIYIKDLVKAIHVIIQNASFNGKAINVASGEAMNIRQVVKEFISYYDNKLFADFTGEVKQGDPLFWQADINLLQSLGFITRVCIQQGIKETVEWLKKQD